MSFCVTRASARRGLESIDESRCCCVGKVGRLCESTGGHRLNAREAQRLRIGAIKRQAVLRRRETATRQQRRVAKRLRSHLHSFLRTLRRSRSVPYQ
jgi:hypothetical protein